MNDSTNIWFGTSGPRTPGCTMIVGEAWGFEELTAQQPFVGQSGKELFRMLSEAWPQRSPALLQEALLTPRFDDWLRLRNEWLSAEGILLTNVLPRKPPTNDMWPFFEVSKEATLPPLRGLHPGPEVRASLETLNEQILAARPTLIIAAGNYALWALTSCTSYSTPAESEGRRCPSGIMAWRGSLWYADAARREVSQTLLLPIIHPAAILRAWYNRSVTVHDLRTRAPQSKSGWRHKERPTFWAPPSFEQAKGQLHVWLSKAERGERVRLLNDIETARGLITCMGFADSKSFAMSIPFVRTQGAGKPFASWWTLEEEITLVKLIRSVLSHPNILVEGQNYLYDIQYILNFLGCMPNLDFDSNVAQHLLFPGTPKDLGYLSSLYCEWHWYWKEDHKEWDMRGTIEDLLVYNCWDCVRNFEVNTTLRALLPKMGMEALWLERKENWLLALEMMLRGVNIDTKHRAQLDFELSCQADDMGRWFLSIIPQSEVTGDKKDPTPWYNSPTQQRQFFGGQLGLRLPLHKKTGNETFGKDGILVLKERHPEFTRLFENLETYRSIRVFRNTFARAPLDVDSRMRTMFNVAGPETFRWSSSENAFGSGTNLQNIPKGEED